MRNQACPVVVEEHKVTWTDCQGGGVISRTVEAHEGNKDLFGEYATLDDLLKQVLGYSRSITCNDANKTAFMHVLK